jgi:hypothetical protein
VTGLSPGYLRQKKSFAAALKQVESLWSERWSGTESL